MARKDHTEVAARISGTALGLFNEAHQALQSANGKLDEGIAADEQERAFLTDRLARASEQKQANEKVASKLKEFLA